MATSRSSSAMARLSRSVAAAAFRASGSGAGAAHQVPRFTTPSCDSQSVRSALSRALISPNQNKIPNAFSTSCLNRGFAFSPALARCYSTSAATAQVPGVKENSALNATLAKVKSLSLFWHINDGIEEIMADYVHQETTRTWILVCFRLFLIIIIKDVFLALTHL